MRFEFSGEESNALSAVAECPLPKQAEISRSYDGHRTFAFTKDFDPDRATGEQLLQKIKELARLISDCTGTFKTAAEHYFKELEALVIQRLSCPSKDSSISGTKAESKSCHSRPGATKDRTVLQEIVQAMVIVAESCPAKSKRFLVEEEITKHLPVFVYMDDYRRYYTITPQDLRAPRESLGA